MVIENFKKHTSDFNIVFLLYVINKKSSWHQYYLFLVKMCHSMTKKRDLTMEVLFLNVNVISFLSNEEKLS
jgi:hypothetical protein